MRQYNRQESIAFWHIETSDPTTSVNDKLLFTTWLNTTTSEIFVCTDNTVDANVWVGQLGTTVS